MAYQYINARGYTTNGTFSVIPKALPVSYVKARLQDTRKGWGNVELSKVQDMSRILLMSFERWKTKAVL